MGIVDLKAAFNEMLGPQGRCSKALLGYKPSGGMEYQMLYFSGTYADGSEFVTQSELIRPSGDLLAASRETATAMLQKRTQ